MLSTEATITVGPALSRTLSTQVPNSPCPIFASNPASIGWPQEFSLSFPHITRDGTSIHVAGHSALLLWRSATCSAGWSPIYKTNIVNLALQVHLTKSCNAGDSPSNKVYSFSTAISWSSKVQLKCKKKKPSRDPIKRRSTRLELFYD
jgi:hypothetical protein